MALTRLGPNQSINLASNVTGALPVANGGTALTSGFSNGITEADMYRVTTSFTGDAEPIASNWERVDTNNFSKIGTGWSESSGIFSAPSTGIYHIKFGSTFYINGDNPWNNVRIATTTDNSSYDISADGFDGSKSAGDTTYCNAVTECIFDVENVSTHKVRFHTRVYNNSSTTSASSTDNECYVTFVRLGDT